MRARLVPFLAALAAALTLGVAGCGGGGDGSGGDPASLVPPQAPVFIEATILPQGETRSNVESLAGSVAGIDDLGHLLVERTEQAAAESGERFDYAKDVEPWLGERVGLYLESYDGEDFSGYGIAVQATDTAAAQAFIEKFVKTDSGGDLEEASYEGVDYRLEPKDGEAIGVVGDFLVFSESEKGFRAMVDASGGKSLADDESFSSATSTAPGGSLADVFVDIGGLIEESGGSIDPETRQLLEGAGIEPREATAVASLVPGSDRIEIDLSTDLAGENPPAGDASELLSSLPGGSFAALAAADFGQRLGEAIDSLDRTGIPGQIPPNELKKTMSAAGIDLEKISGSIGDVAVFAQGNSERNLTGAVVIETTGSREATNTVSNIGLLLRASGTPGVTALSGKATGFSVRDPELGRQPLVVAAQGSRIAISYGFAASAQALSAGSGSTLAANPEYREAVSALGGTPISGFVNGPAAVALAKNLIPPADAAGFAEARPYLDKVGYVAIGAGSSGDEATAKLIVGLGN